MMIHVNHMWITHDDTCGSCMFHIAASGILEPLPVALPCAAAAPAAAASSPSSAHILICCTAQARGFSSLLLSGMSLSLYGAYVQAASVRKLLRDHVPGVTAEEMEKVIVHAGVMKSFTDKYLGSRGVGTSTSSPPLPSSMRPEPGSICFSKYRVKVPAPQENCGGRLPQHGELVGESRRRGQQ